MEEKYKSDFKDTSVAKKFIKIIILQHYFYP